MAWSRSGGSMISAPRLVTLIVSLLLVGAALASLRIALPGPLHLVAPHRTAVLVAGYAALLAGVLTRRL